MKVISRKSKVGPTLATERLAEAAAIVFGDAAGRSLSGRGPELTILLTREFGTLRTDGRLEEETHTTAIKWAQEPHIAALQVLCVASSVLSRFVALGSASISVSISRIISSMAGPSHCASCDAVQPVDADQLQQILSQDVTVDNLQLALPSPNRDQRYLLMNLDVLPLQSFDPVLEQLLNEAEVEAGITAPFSDQVPEQMFNVIPQPAAATQPLPGNFPNCGRFDDSPARNTRSQREESLAAPRRPFSAGSRGGRERGHRADERLRLHVASERRRRHEMSEQFAALRMMLPSSATLSRMDRSSVVQGAINLIATLEAELERLQGTAPRTSLPANGGLVCVDYTGNSNALTAITSWPMPGSDPSAMASFLGTNVAIHICGQNCFFVISSPRRGRQVGLLERIFVVIYRHHLEVLCASVADRDNTVVYTINCQAHQNANLLSNDLHAALQSVVNEFIRTN